MPLFLVCKNTLELSGIYRGNITFIPLKKLEEQTAILCSIYEFSG